MFQPIKIRYYVSALQERGFEAEATLLGSGIQQERFDDPAYLIDLYQCQIVVENMIRLTGDQGIGLDVGKRMQLADFGILAHAMISSSTLQQAALYWVKYSNLAGMMINIHLDSTGDEWTIEYQAEQQTGFIYNFCVEEMSVSGLQMVPVLTGQPVLLQEAQFSYPAPLHAEKYEEYFDCPIRFNAHKSAITIKSPGISTPLPRNDEQLHDICDQHCQQIMREFGQYSFVISSLRKHFLANPGAIPSFVQAAEFMDMSPRTLRRRLLEEGTHYQALVQQFRLDIANRYLKSRQLNTKEVGDLLGYSDTNAFRRAFKSWTGKTIKEYYSSVSK